MSDRDDSGPDDERRLQALEQRLRERRPAEPPQRQSDMGALGAAWRMSVELVAALVVGGGLGLLLDRLFHTAPWILVVGVVLGFAAGVRNAVRMAYSMQVPPTGRARPGDDENGAG